MEVDFLSGLICKSLFCVHVTISFRYGCRFCCAVFVFTCEDSVVMSSAYVDSETCSGGVGMSDMYMLKSVGERTPP